MKLIDREGRIFGKISVIDVLVIAVVLVLAVALYVKNTKTETSSLITEQTIIFQVKAQGLDNYIADAIRVGDYVYDRSYSSGGRPLGRITDVQVTRDPGRRMALGLPGGEAAYIDTEETVDLCITIEGTGLTDGRTCTLNRVYALGINSSRTYYTNRTQFNIVVSDILL